jgi:hypothetical protein
MLLVGSAIPGVVLQVLAHQLVRSQALGRERIADHFLGWSTRITVDRLGREQIPVFRGKFQNDVSNFVEDGETLAFGAVVAVDTDQVPAADEHRVTRGSWGEFAAYAQLCVRSRQKLLQINRNRIDPTPSHECPRTGLNRAGACWRRCSPLINQSASYNPASVVRRSGLWRS